MKSMDSSRASIALPRARPCNQPNPRKGQCHETTHPHRRPPPDLRWPPSFQCHAADTHPLQPNAPRTVTVSEADTPPVIRAGLLQSTLIVLARRGEGPPMSSPGTTVDWVFDGGHVASRFISVKPKVANGSTDIHIISDHGNESTPCSSMKSPASRMPTSIPRSSLRSRRSGCKRQAGTASGLCACR